MFQKGILDSLKKIFLLKNFVKILLKKKNYYFCQKN